MKTNGTDKLIRDISEFVVNTNEFENDLDKLSDWEECTMQSGYPALIAFILEAQELNSDLDWEKAINFYWRKLKDKIIINTEINNNSNIFNGYCGVGFMLLELKGRGVDTDKLLNVINKRVINIIRFKIKHAVSNLEKNEVCDSDYDIIYGLSSSFRYLVEFKENEEIEELIKEILRYFVELVSHRQLEDKIIPNYYIKANKIYSKEMREKYKNGVINFSSAHGMAGVLSAFVIAKKNGFIILGQLDAMKVLVETYKKITIRENGLVYWPGTVDINEYLKNNISIDSRGIYSWCYGIPGIARSLYITAKVLCDEDLEDLAIEALTCICNSISNIKIDTCIVCHGYCSLLLVLNEMYRDTDNSIYKKGCNELKKIIENKYMKNLAFECLGTIAYPQRELSKYSISILEGLLGIGLTLISSKTGKNTILSKILLIN